ncbi:MAG TPA: LLM class flavin-dependent oxidoreductase [Chloroflexota bacterium]|jgi:5,10-methylenetetrahydromethanopterin reductase
MTGVECWRVVVPLPGVTARVARAAEAEGWDGLAVTESQNIYGDPYVALALAARATERLRLATGVVNPVTRHPAVTAAAIATLHAESGGRAVLGIGRGDSALAHLGRPPAPLPLLAEYVARVQGYLRGEAVAIDGVESRLEWLPALGLPKVPVNVTATGPRGIALGARLAEWVTFTVGADRERIAGAVATARAARQQAGLDPATVSLGAYLPIAVHSNIAVARELVRGVVGIHAHFSGMAGATAASLAPADRAVVEGLRREYDLAHHGMGQAAHARLLDDAFMDRFAIVGSADRCLARLEALVALGLDRLVLTTSARDALGPDQQLAAMLLAREVLPIVQRMNPRPAASAPGN